MKKILIIEDDRMMIRILQDYFMENDAECLLAPEATEAVQKARDNAPDLIILDMVLGGRSGLDVLRQIKDSAETAAIPVVVFSATDQEDIIAAAKDLGAADYIVKGSVSLGETLRRMKKYIE